MIPLKTTVTPLSIIRRFTTDSRRIGAIDQFAEFAGADWPLRIMSEVVSDRFHAKQGRSIGRWVLTHPETNQRLSMYLKRHYDVSRWDGLRAVLQPRRAWSPGLQEAEHLDWARQHGLPVPRTIAVGEYRGRWGRLSSFLAVEELAGMLPLHEAIPLARQRLSKRDFDRFKRGLICELARLTRELHRQRGFHNDLYLCHFYLRESDCNLVPSDFCGKICMIDFHRLVVRPRFAVWYQIKDLAQLLYSCTETACITQRDRARFWAEYRAGDWSGSQPPKAWMRVAIVRKCALYERHNRRRLARRAKVA